jgi:outer membrane protein assembly factor BamB
MPLTAVGAKTGATRWTAQVPDSNGMQIAGGTTLYIAAQASQSGQNSIVWALAEEDGTIQWKFDTGEAQRAYIAIQ